MSTPEEIAREIEACTSIFIEEESSTPRPSLKRSRSAVSNREMLRLHKRLEAKSEARHRELLASMARGENRKDARHNEMMDVLRALGATNTSPPATPLSSSTVRTSSATSSTDSSIGSSPRVSVEHKDLYSQWNAAYGHLGFIPKKDVQTMNERFNLGQRVYFSVSRPMKCPTSGGHLIVPGKEVLGKNQGQCTQICFMHCKKTRPHSWSFACGEHKLFKCPSTEEQRRVSSITVNISSLQS